MPHSSCAPCCDPTGNSKGVDLYRSSVVQILCSILDALGGLPATTEPTADSFIEDVATGAPTVFTFTGPVKGISVVDTAGSILEVTVSISGGTLGGNNLLYVPSSGTLQYELTTTSPALITSLSITRLAGGVASGDVIVNGSHPGL